MRTLNRNRDELRIGDLEELSLVGKLLAAPSLPQDCDRFFETRLTFTVIDVVDLVLTREATSADTEIKTTAANLID